MSGKKRKSKVGDEQNSGTKLGVETDKAGKPMDVRDETNDDAPSPSVEVADADENNDNEVMEELQTKNDGKPTRTNSDSSSLNIPPTEDNTVKARDENKNAVKLESPISKDWLKSVLPGETSDEIDECLTLLRQQKIKIISHILDTSADTWNIMIVSIGFPGRVRDALKKAAENMNGSGSRKLSSSGIDALNLLVKEIVTDVSPSNFIWLGPPEGWEKTFRSTNSFWGKLAPPCSRRVRRKGENPNVVDLLFSEHLVTSKGPFDKLQALGPKQFRLLKGPSGCGKTRAIVETGRHRYVLLLDFSQESVSQGTRNRDPSVQQLCSDLMQIYQAKISVISADNLARYVQGTIRVLIEIFARLLFLLFLSQNTTVTPKLFLDSQYDGGQAFVLRAIAVFRQFSFWSDLQELVQLVRRCFAELKKKGIDNVIVAVDEAGVPKSILGLEVLTQHTAELCQRGQKAYDMHGVLLPEYQRGALGLINGALFHIDDLTSTVFASTMTLDKEEMSATAVAKGLDVQVISDFRPFSSDDVFDFLERFLNLPTDHLKRIASGLAGRIRWSEEFVRQLIRDPADPLMVLESTLDVLTRVKIPTELNSAKLRAHERRLLTRMVICFEKLHSSPYFVAAEEEGKFLQNFVAFTRKKTDAFVEYRIVDPVVARGCLFWLQSRNDKESLVSSCALKDFCDTLQPMMEAGKGEKFEDVVTANLFTVVKKQGVDSVKKLVDRIEPGLGASLNPAFASKSLAIDELKSHSDCASDVDVLQKRPARTLIKCHVAGPDALHFLDEETSMTLADKCYGGAVPTEQTLRNFRTTDVNNIFLGKNGLAAPATQSYRKQAEDILKHKPIRMQIRLNVILPRSQKPKDPALEAHFSSHVAEGGTPSSCG